AADLRLGGQTNTADPGEALSFKQAKQRVIDTFERDFISRALRRHQGNITRAAEEMGLHRQQLQQKIRDLELQGWDETEGSPPR
ncbi:MAG TPA: helix-turn-helix domain-containing protein, partial [Candidatus Binatia bacterium]|nr:helix-turn-helix domain-containing protein [Candidatus Binatia bacterium]